MEEEVRLDLILGRSGDECVQRGTYRPGPLGVDPRSRQGRGLALDPEPEIEHVEHVVVGSDGSGLDGERRRLGHREHE